MDLDEQVDRHGVLWWGTVISGILMIIVAAFIPFNNLNDMISAGILVAFAMTFALFRVCWALCASCAVRGG